MKKKFLLLTLLFCVGLVNAQLLKIMPGAGITIQNGATLSTDGLSITPSADFTINENSLDRFTTVTNSTASPYISRVYRFTNNTNTFTGNIQINYSDGAELNGIPENRLTLNIHNGTLWTDFPATIRDGTNNFVLSNGVSSILNELTLADQQIPLPLTWLSFTATKQQKTALLQWATANEQNTSSFTLQHSSNAVDWVGLTILPAVGNSNTTNNYRYIHTNPAWGINYYRVLQTDINNQSSFSFIRSLTFTDDQAPFVIMGNPVNNGILNVQINKRINLSLYTAAGKLLWQQAVNAGIKAIDVSRFSKGIYFLQADGNTEKVLIQ